MCEYREWSSLHPNFILRKKKNAAALSIPFIYFLPVLEFLLELYYCTMKDYILGCCVYLLLSSA